MSGRNIQTQLKGETMTDNIFPPLPRKKYSIIYADPPWKFRTYSIPENGKRFKNARTNWRNADVHYPTLDIHDIAKLDVNRISRKDSILFMWVTWPLMPRALEIIEKWGFTYKTLAFDWVKLCKKDHTKWSFGMGYWTRSNPEPCLLATKGNPHRMSASIRNIILEEYPLTIVDPIRHHSKKPDIIRDKIVELCGDLPRIELFARPPAPEGWDTWGNEIQ